MNMIYTSKSNLFLSFNDQMKVRLIYLYCHDNSSTLYVECKYLLYLQYIARGLMNLVSDFTSLNENSCWSLRQIVHTLKQFCCSGQPKKSSFDSQRIPSLCCSYTPPLFPFFPLFLSSLGELKRGSGSLFNIKNL